MIYGTLPLTIEDDSTDRIGIRTLVLAQMWQPVEVPFTALGLTNETPAIPEVPGGLELMGRQTRRQGGVLRTSWTFEGVDGDGKSVTFKGRHNTTDYQFDPGFSQVDIKLHPDFERFKEEGLLTLDADGQVTWPARLASTSKPGLGAADSSGEGDKNPLFGFDEFLRLEGTYSCRYAAFTMGSAEAGIGRIYNAGSLPGRAPSFEGRNWLKAPSPYQRRGPILEITEVYWLSGPGGWPKTLYGTGAE